jgi:ABC-type nitrate/sulfonate/bicarbonate transport system substrate-binding protein
MKKESGYIGHSFRMFMTVLLLVVPVIFMSGCKDNGDKGAEKTGLNGTVITVSTPPDPNFIPIAVLEAKAKEWMPGVTVKVVTAPAGDPSAMRAMIQKKAVDFALFNILGGTKFFNGGLKDIRLVGTHVWKGVYLVTQEQITDVKELQNETLLALPSIKTPPHVVTAKALKKLGVKAEFVPSGSGPSLIAQLARPEKAPKGFVAPEPFVSIVLAKQKRGNWPVKYKVLMDPQKVLNPTTGEIPLGSLWLINPEFPKKNKDAAASFIKGFERAVLYCNDKANLDEVSAIVAASMSRIYGQAAGTRVYRNMISSGRLGLDFRSSEKIKDLVTKDLKALYNVDVKKEIFYKQR